MTGRRSTPQNKGGRPSKGARDHFTFRPPVAIGKTIRERAIAADIPDNDYINMLVQLGLENLPVDESQPQQVAAFELRLTG